jgi:uncharacterized protein
MAGIHVSLHDVSPAFETEVETALAICARYAIKPALLVVPNFHGEASLPDFPKFVDKLRRLVGDGHEVYLHGFLHSASSGSFFRQRVVSQGEAEFAELSPAEAARRLDAGLEMLRALQLPVSGFVAPAWSFQPWLPHLLGVRNIAYTEDHLNIYDCVRRARTTSLVFNYASRSRLRMASTVAFCRAAAFARAWVPPVANLPARIALHPKDMRFRTLRRETHGLLAHACDPTSNPPGQHFPQANYSKRFVRSTASRPLEPFESRVNVKPFWLALVHGTRRRPFTPGAGASSYSSSFAWLWNSRRLRRNDARLAPIGGSR